MSGGQFIRVIRRRELLALAFGAMIGWSWVALSGGWISEAGSVGAMLAIAGGGIAVMLVGLTYAELASAMPLAGGEHVYSRRALGRNASFVCTWAILLAYVSVVTFEAVALPTVVEYLLPGYSRGYLWTVAGWDVELTWVLVGIAASVLMTWINIIGIKVAARLQMLVTSLILLAGLVILFGASFGGDAQNMQPLFNNGVKGWVGVLVVVPVMLVGFDVIPQSAEEIDLPPKRIAKLMVVSVMIAVAWYIAVSFAVAVALTGDELAGSTLASGDAATALWGSSWAGAALVVGGIGGILTSWNAFLIGGSRVLFALAGSGMVPKVFGRLHPRYQTPYVAIIGIGIFSCLAPLLGRAVLVWMVNASSFAVVIAYLMVAIAFLILRRREPDMPRPFKVSHPNLVGYGAVAMSLALLCVFLPWSPSALVCPYEWGMLLLWAVLGLLLFVRYRN